MTASQAQGKTGEDNAKDNVVEDEREPGATRDREVELVDERVLAETAQGQRLQEKQAARGEMASRMEGKERRFGNGEPPPGGALAEVGEGNAKDNVVVDERKPEATQDHAEAKVVGEWVLADTNNAKDNVVVDEREQGALGRPGAVELPRRAAGEALPHGAQAAGAVGVQGSSATGGADAANVGQWSSGWALAAEGTLERKEQDCRIRDAVRILPALRAALETGGSARARRAGLLLAMHALLVPKDSRQHDPEGHGWAEKLTDRILFLHAGHNRGGAGARAGQRPLARKGGRA